MIDIVFAGIGTVSTALRTLGSLARSTKGLERSFLLEVRQNIELLEEYRKAKLDAKRLIPELETDKFQNIYGTNYRFSKLQRKNVSVETTADLKRFKRYEGWDTEKLVTNIYRKIIHLQKLVKIGFDDSRIDIPQRLHNLLALFLLLSRHIA